LLLDEPTRNFSPLSGPVIRRMLAAFPGAILSVSHDRKYIEEVCGTILELTENGLNPKPIAPPSP
ncbi:MAG: ABC transporter ATP-binding protein, partial [Firmicutes bacterium]|nr:ABC transporter ATP-binding protein [Bacillota bacterium]